MVRFLVLCLIASANAWRPHHGPWQRRVTLTGTRDDGSNMVSSPHDGEEGGLVIGEIELALYDDANIEEIAIDADEWREILAGANEVEPIRLAR